MGFAAISTMLCDIHCKRRALYHTGIEISVCIPQAAELLLSSQHQAALLRYQLGRLESHWSSSEPRRWRPALQCALR